MPKCLEENSLSKCVQEVLSDLSSMANKCAAAEQAQLVDNAPVTLGVGELALPQGGKDVIAMPTISEQVQTEEKEAGVKASA